VYERTQRHVCRIAFLALCAVPTALTLAWVVYFHRPWQERDWQQWAEQTLHVRTSIERVTAPRPGERKLGGVRCADLQSGSLLAELDELAIRRDGSLVAQRLTIPCDHLPRLAAAVSTWLATDTHAPTFTAEQADFVGPARQLWTIRHLRAKGSSSSAASRNLQWEGQVAATAEPLRMAIERQEDGKLRMALDCSAGGLPAWMFARLLPSANRWSAAQLQGVLQCETDQQVSRGSWRGTAGPLDVQTWLGPGARHRIEAQVTVRWETLVWEHTHLVSAQGKLESGPGRMSGSLLADLAKLLYCRLEKDPSAIAAGEMVSFDQLACEFQLTSQGLTIHGRCPGFADSPGVVLVAAGQPLLREPAQQNLPALLFVHAFCPQSEAWLPANHEAVRMFEGLPVPAATSQRPALNTRW
jgi:hypothetical protein